MKRRIEGEKPPFLLCCRSSVGPKLSTSSTTSKLVIGAGASSLVEIMVSLYFNRLRIKPEDCCSENRDCLLLSKGHASMIYYTVFTRRGFIEESEFDTFRDLNSWFQGYFCITESD